MTIIREREFDELEKNRYNIELDLDSALLEEKFKDVDQYRGNIERIVS